MDTTTFPPVNGTVLGPPGRRAVLDDAHVGANLPICHARAVTGCWRCWR
jgi:hypothetical protein